MEPRNKWDLSDPRTQGMRDEIVHGAFLTEGTAVAFPLCFPGVTEPIPADESRVTALDTMPDGVIYGGTSGVRAHVFVAMFHGATGMVFDLGALSGLDRVEAVCCGERRVIAAANGPEGGRLVRFAKQPLPFDLLQEWQMGRPEIEDLGPVGEPGERVVHACADSARTKALVLTEKRLIVRPIDDGTEKVLARLPGRGHIGHSVGDTFVGLDDSASLWFCDLASGEVRRNAIRLPTEGEWEGVDLRWARHSASGRLYTTDAAGRLFSLSPKGKFSEPFGQSALTPVTTLAATFDGRVFGTAGDGIGKMFRYDPASSALDMIGVAVSTLQRRRYGYQFGAACVGREGQIVFGENDDLGHLWLYFPRIGGGQVA